MYGHVDATSSSHNTASSIQYFKGNAVLDLMAVKLPSTSHRKGRRGSGCLSSASAAGCLNTTADGNKAVSVEQCYSIELQSITLFDMTTIHHHNRPNNSDGTEQVFETRRASTVPVVMLVVANTCCDGVAVQGIQSHDVTVNAEGDSVVSFPTPPTEGPSLDCETDSAPGPMVVSVASQELTVDINVGHTRLLEYAYNIGQAVFNVQDIISRIVSRKQQEEWKYAPHKIDHSSSSDSENNDSAADSDTNTSLSSESTNSHSASQRVQMKSVSRASVVESQKRTLNQHDDQASESSDSAGSDIYITETLGGCGVLAQDDDVSEQTDDDEDEQEEAEGENEHGADAVAAVNGRHHTHQSFIGQRSVVDREVRAAEDNENAVMLFNADDCSNSDDSDNDKSGSKCCSDDDDVFVNDSAFSQEWSSSSSSMRLDSVESVEVIPLHNETAAESADVDQVGDQDTQDDEECKSSQHTEASDYDDDDAAVHPRDSINHTGKQFHVDDASTLNEFIHSAPIYDTCDDTTAVGIVTVKVRYSSCYLSRICVYIWLVCCIVGYTNPCG